MIQPIGKIETCFTEKFGVPRQSLMVKAARGVIVLDPEFSHPESVLHLESFSHLWVIYEFHKAQTPNHPLAWSPTVVPPRIDAPPKVGVFASRSPHRPNPIGLSVVRLEGIGIGSDLRIRIDVSGVDILDGSPVFDLKPYVPYADALPDASSGWITREIERYPVEFTERARVQALQAQNIELLTGILEWDPRPRSQREACPLTEPGNVGRRFAFRLGDLDIHWEISGPGIIRVLELKEDVGAPKSE